MNKNLFSLTKLLLVFSTIILILSSCVEEKYYPVDESAYWDNRKITVKQRQWQWDNVKECYFYEEDAPWIGNFIASDGIVIGLVRNEGTLKPLPFTAYYYQETSPNNGYFFSETISYEYKTNYIRFNVAASDLFDGTDPTYLPKEYEFQIRLIW